MLTALIIASVLTIPDVNFNLMYVALIIIFLFHDFINFIFHLIIPLPDVLVLPLFCTTLPVYSFESGLVESQ